MEVGCDVIAAKVGTHIAQLHKLAEQAGRVYARQCDRLVVKRQRQVEMLGRRLAHCAEKLRASAEAAPQPAPSGPAEARKARRMFAESIRQMKKIGEDVEAVVTALGQGVRAAGIVDAGALAPGVEEEVQALEAKLEAIKVAIEQELQVAAAVPLPDRSQPACSNGNGQPAKTGGAAGGGAAAGSGSAAGGGHGGGGGGSAGGARGCPQEGGKDGAEGFVHKAQGKGKPSKGRKGHRRSQSEPVFAGQWVPHEMQPMMMPQAHLPQGSPPQMQLQLEMAQQAYHDALDPYQGISPMYSYGRTTNLASPAYEQAQAAAAAMAMPQPPDQPT